MASGIRDFFIGFDESISGSRQAVLLRVIQRVLGERIAVRIEEGSPSDLFLEIEPRETNDGYIIESKTMPNRSFVSGSSYSGLWAGVGRWLRRASYSGGMIQPGHFREASTADSPVRGIYFATHYKNFFHVAKEDEVKSYIEDLALWGCNHLAAWFDMHHFHGMEQPEAELFLGRLVKYFTVAESLGIAPALLLLANEGFADTLEELRAEWVPQENYFGELQGHYHVEICPSKPGGMDLIEKNRRAVFESFRGVHFRQIIVWPYDQGGCTCDECYPWGSKTFPELAMRISGIAREYFPEVEIVLSTWSFERFSKGEWSQLDESFSKDPPTWANYLLADGMDDEFPQYPLMVHSPGNLPILTFPEISMEGMVPWGGFGANPMPARMNKYWSELSNVTHGGYPYSEGIYEDVNKVIMLSQFWGNTCVEALEEYVSFEFSREKRECIVELLHALESQTSHGYYSDILRGEANLASGRLREEEFSSLGFYVADRLGTASDTWKKIQEVDAGLDDRARKSWRWRLVFLRAAIDSELESSGGKLSDRLDSLIEEVLTINQTENARFPARPLNRRTLAEVVRSEDFREDEWNILGTRRDATLSKLKTIS